MSHCHANLVDAAIQHRQGGLHGHPNQQQRSATPYRRFPLQRARAFLHLRAAFTAGMGFFTDAYDPFLIGSALAYIKSRLAENPVL